MNIGRNIQFLRKQKKITQEQLAEEMSVFRQTVSKWETDEIYSAITVKTIKGFRMARYVMITPNPENDVNRYMDAWAKESGLLALYPDARRIGWDFPHVSSELQNRFGLWGYVSAYILPADFQTDFPGVEYADQMEAEYAVITVHDPFSAFERIPNAYKKIMEYLQANGFREKPRDNILSCFEYVYEKNGQTCMDVHIHTESVSKTDAFTNFS